MFRVFRRKHTWLVLISGAVLAGATGQGCPGFGGGDGSELDGGGAPVTFEPVTVELINTLPANEVQPFFYSDPGTLDFAEDVMIPANLVDIGPPLAPLEGVSLTLACEDAGTFVMDADMYLAPTGQPAASSNILLLQEGVEFFCGDIVSFYYEVDAGGVFFTSVDVNDVYLAP